MQLEDRKKLREHFRQRRNALSPQQQQYASGQLLNKCIELRLFEHSKRVAFYLVNDGELNPVQVIEYCWKNNIEVFLPVLHPFTQGHLLFVRYHPSSSMKPNQFGISEPIIQTADICPLPELDIIFAPLVAFDTEGNRMGMGGGFYDRTLAPIKRDGLRTQLIGLAHSCQQAHQLPNQDWDIPMEKIVAV